jgi:uncharacterized protein
VSRRRPWFLPHHPDVVGLLLRQADVTVEALQAFASWSGTGADEEAERVRELEHAGDDARRDLLRALIDALVTEIEQEDAYALSERIDEVLDRAKDTVRTASALSWTPDTCAAAMGEHAHAASLHLRDAIRKLGDREGHPGEDAELAIKRARRIEHALRDGLRGLPRDGDHWQLSAALAVYRNYSAVGDSLLRVADRTWYSVLKAR